MYKAQNQKVVLSGIQPTGFLHLGHLLGVLKNFVELQKQYKCFYMIADLHSLTTLYDSYLQTKPYILDIIGNWIASGLDPNKSTLFLQSMVPEHAQMMNLLSSFTPVSWLLRNPSYKEKKDNIDKDINNLGFLSYPVLQATDILLYNSHFVPVGEDQISHIEMTREIARRVHSIVKRNVFVVPQEKLSPFPKVLGTDGRKMSKSYNNTIQLKDSPNEIQEKIKKMKTDVNRVYRSDPGNPQNCPVFSYYDFFYPSKKKEIEHECKTAKIGCVDCKGIISQKVQTKLEPHQDKYNNMIQKPQECIEIIKEGSQEARKTAKETLQRLKKAVGFDESFL